MRTRARLIELCRNLNERVVGPRIVVGAKLTALMLMGLRNRRGWLYLKLAIRDAEAKELWWTFDMLRECRAMLVMPDHALDREARDLVDD